MMRNTTLQFFFKLIIHPYCSVIFFKSAELESFVYGPVRKLAYECNKKY